MDAVERVAQILHDSDDTYFEHGAGASVLQHKGQWIC
jgi:hypothetical protein